VRQKHGEERLSKGVEPRAHRLGGGDLQQPVNGDDPRRGLDQVGIDECALVLDRETMNCGNCRHGRSFQLKASSTSACPMPRLALVI
jgi:hypothetical protein